MLGKQLPDFEDLARTAMIRDALLSLAEVPASVIEETRASYGRMREQGTRRRLAIPIALARGTIGGLMERHPNY